MHLHLTIQNCLTTCLTSQNTVIRRTKDVIEIIVYCELKRRSENNKKQFITEKNLPVESEKCLNLLIIIYHC